MHILLRPVPGLSATLERPSSHLPRRCRKMHQHRHALFHARHRRPSPAIKMAPRGTRKNALLATWTRGCLARVASAPAGTGAGSALAPHPSLPAAVVAAPSLRRSRTPAPQRTSSQPPAMTKSAVTMRLAVSLATISRPATSRSMLPGSQRAEELRGNGAGALPRTRNGDRKAGMDPHSAFRSPAPLNAAEAWCRVGGGRSIPPTRAIPPGQRNAVSCMRSALTLRKKDEDRGRAVSPACRRDRCIGVARGRGSRTTGR